MSELQRQLSVETILTAQPFEELLGLAVETCLRDPSLFEEKLKELREKYQPSQMASVVQRAGLWSVREALDYSTGDLLAPDFEDIEEDLSLRPYMRGPINPEIQLKIEAFGQAVLEEAFVCLGDDAEKMVGVLNNAKTRRKKLNVYNWLAKRIDGIRQVHNPTLDEETEQSSEDSGDSDRADGSRAETSPEDEPGIVGFDPSNPVYLYHPARIAPKFIGKYPNIKTDPTCLGLSILAASFFEKTCRPYLHAGLVRTAADEHRLGFVLTINVILEFAKENAIKIPDRLKTLFNDIAETARSSLLRDTGFHAVVLSLVDDNTWAQTDPNFNSNLILSEHGSQKVKEAYNKLKDLEHDAKGVETLIMNRSILGPYWFRDFARQLKEASLNEAEIEQRLLELPEETTVEEFIRHFYKELIPDTTSIDDYKYIKEQILVGLGALKRIKTKRDEDYEAFIMWSLKGALFKNVFPDAKDQDISTCIRRCKTDVNYLRRRGEDLKLAPFIALLALEIDIGNNVIKGYIGQSHSMYEVGLPAYRIGACVLSDFAVYCGDELPPSFWLSYWPSHISFAEHANRKVKSSAQQELIAQIAEYIDQTEWTYGGVYDIVSDVLEQENKGGGTSGN